MDELDQLLKQVHDTAIAIDDSLKNTKGEPDAVTVNVVGALVQAAARTLELATARITKDRYRV